MTPIFEYACTRGHNVEVIRKYEDRDEPVACTQCGEPMDRQMSAHHRQPDGIYSYAPNTGDPNRHEERNEKAKALREDRS